MTGLVLKLKPHEKILINGVVLQNGDRSARLRIRTAGASVLRMRDAMHPSQAVTPLRKLYHVAQLAVAGEVTDAAARAELSRGVDILLLGAVDVNARSALEGAKKELADGKLFAAMRHLKSALAFDPNLTSQECSSLQSP